MVLADAFTLSSQPWYVLTMQGMNHKRIDQERVHKRPEYIPTQP